MTVHGFAYSEIQINRLPHSCLRWHNKYVFVLYLAVNDRIRSKGYGTKILDWLKQNTEKIIVLNVEAINSSAKNALQREKRISFYNR